ncbi:hypothetical protein M5K25_025745 [Dendrobium thyrsiflorum]|uniref:Uncharacterized protein n=1 Tax=Dendrobium thyrsiflorum TaxID=117978 RepID=A0ABD0U4U9_DENTH
MPLPKNPVGSGGLSRFRPSTANRSLVGAEEGVFSALVRARQTRPVRAAKLVGGGDSPWAVARSLRRESLSALKVKLLWMMGMEENESEVDREPARSENSGWGNSTAGGRRDVKMERSRNGGRDIGRPRAISAQE